MFCPRHHPHPRHSCTTRFSCILARLSSVHSERTTRQKMITNLSHNRSKEAHLHLDGGCQGSGQHVTSDTIKQVIEQAHFWI